MAISYLLEELERCQHCRNPLNEPDLNGNRPLHVLCGRGFLEGVRLLLYHPDLDPEACNKDGFTAYDLAKESKFKSILKELENVLYWNLFYKAYLIAANNKFCVNKATWIIVA